MQDSREVIDWRKGRWVAFVDAFRDIFGGFVIGGVVITGLGTLFGVLLGPFGGVAAFLLATFVAAGVAGPIAWKRQLESARLEMGVPLDLGVIPRLPKRPPNWGGMYRVDALVENKGGKVRLQAKMRIVRGGAEDDYRSFLLQWDIVDRPDLELHRDDSHYLHLLRTKDREVQFLGPEKTLGSGPVAYKVLKPAGDLWFQFELRDIDTGRFKLVECRLSFDHEYVPYLDVLGVNEPTAPDERG